LTMISIMLPRASVAAERIDEVLQADISITNAEETKSMNGPGTIAFENVTFAYPDADEPILKNVNFTAEAGKTTALIGSTGSGKSTLVQLVPRLFDVTGGKITIDGTDIRQIDLEELRRNIG